MRNLWPFATLVALSLSPPALPHLMSEAFAANGGGGSGTTPTPQPDRKYALRLAVEGRATGLSGTQTFVFRLMQTLPCAVCAPTTLYTETRNVYVSNGRFSTQLGVEQSSTLTSQTVAGRDDMHVAWALASAPTVTLGTMPLYSVVSAHGLSPEAKVTATSSAPALDIDTTGAVSVQAWTQADKRAVQIDSPGTALYAERNHTSTGAVYANNQSYPSMALWATASGANSTAVRLEAPSGGKLIESKQNGNVKFEVRADGTVWSGTTQITHQGPKGNPGSDGQDGADGNDGQPSSSDDFCIASASKSNCNSVCFNGAVVKEETKGQCSIWSGLCYSNSSSGVCCVCGAP